MTRRQIAHIPLVVLVLLIGLPGIIVALLYRALAAWLRAYISALRYLHSVYMPS
jgi:hypothetical protein